MLRLSARVNVRSPAGRSLIIEGPRVISVDGRGRGGDRGAATARKCRGYGRGVSRNATAAGPSGGFIAGAPIDVGGGGGGEGVGSPGCPWVVDALPGQRINSGTLIGSRAD